jgi:protein-S-isoprenylcysteine O-methyltransferase Ste14
MLSKKVNNILLFLLALIFSLALMFAFTEIPRLIDLLLQNKVGFPDFDQGISEQNIYKSNLYISVLHLRWIGYLNLFLVLGFIILGFITKKSGWAWAGALTLFLPVFGQFALNMFFLAGLGILRVGWLPFIDISNKILALGDVIYLPYRFLIWFFSLFNWYAHNFISYFFMAAGSFLFVWGVLVWFQTRSGNQLVASSRIYKFSRHPQYLGWIIWSYGFMLFSSGINVMKKTWTVSSSLPWLLASMVIIAICLLEEIYMQKTGGETYQRYRRQTPFLFPLPKWLKAVINAPMKLFIRKNQPESKLEVAGVVLLYTGLLMAFSFFTLDWGEKGREERLMISSNPQRTVDSLIREIRKPQSRRYINTHFAEMEKLGAFAVAPLISLLSDSNPVVREFSAITLGNMMAVQAVESLIDLLNDPQGRVRNTAAISLGKIGSEKALSPLIKHLQTSTGQGIRHHIYRALGNIGSATAWSILVQGTQDSLWFQRVAALNGLNVIDPEKSLEYIIPALEDEDVNVRRHAVTILLEQKPLSARAALEKVLDDQDFETRFYARQAIKLIDVKFSQ